MTEPGVATPKTALPPSARENRITALRLSPALRTWGMVVVIAAAWIFFYFYTAHVFLAPRNLSNLVRQTAVTGILSVGMMLVIVTGQIDLSVGSIVGLSGGVAAILQSWYGWGLVSSIAAGLVVGLAIGWLQGAIVAYINVPSFIATLGGLLAWRGVIKGVTQGKTIPTSIKAFRAIGQDYIHPKFGWVLAALAIAGLIAGKMMRDRRRKNLGLAASGAASWVNAVAVPAAAVVAFIAVMNAYAGVPAPGLILVVIALIATFVTDRTVFGRYLYAIGGNPEAARLSGINLRRNILATFCIMGVLAAGAGIIYTARVGSASPDAGTLLELDAIAACVIGGASLMGGRGTVLGACLGALFMATLDNGMSLKNIPDFVQDIVKGGILVAAVGIDTLNRRR